jgi:hypothetical protein
MSLTVSCACAMPLMLINCHLQTLMVATLAWKKNPESCSWPSAIVAILIYTVDVALAFDPTQAPRIQGRR